MSDMSDRDGGRIGAGRAARVSPAAVCETPTRVGPRRPAVRPTLVQFFAVSLGVAFALVCLRAASAAPPTFSLTFDGAHVADASLPAGIRHDGRFTASAPFCSAGRAYDVRQVDDGASLAVWRLHMCDDGSGSFTAYMPADVRGEHGGTGAWQIVEGTGRYTTLRGRGTYTGTLLSGDPVNFSTIVYRTQWHGLVDFDADPPAIQSFTATAKKLPLARRTYSLRIAVTAQDPSAPILFLVDVKAGRSPLTTKISKAAEKALMVLRVSPPSSARSVRIALATTDALGNTSTSTRSVKLGSG